MAENCIDSTESDTRSFLIHDILKLDKESNKTSKEKIECILFNGVLTVFLLDYFPQRLPLKEIVY